MLLSIITICYNDKEGLIKTAHSVISQTHKDYEWIVIDGGSNDGSQEVINQYKSFISHYVSEPDNGIYNAMNKGLFYAKGDYCLFLNSGDRFCSPKSVLRISNSKPTCDFVSFDIFSGDSRFLNVLHSPNTINMIRFIIGNLPHQSTIIKTTILKESKYDETYSIISDWIMWIDCLIVKKCSYQHTNIPIAIYDTNGISSIQHDRNIKERKEYLSRYISTNYLQPIIDSANVKGVIEASYMPQAEKRCLLFTKSILDFLGKITNKVNDIYLNIRYRNQI